MSTPQYDFFTQFECAWDARSLSSPSSAFSTSTTASSLAPSSRRSSTASLLHLYVPLPPHEDDPPIHDISLSPTPTVSEVNNPFSRPASHVSTSDVEYLGRLHLRATDSVEEIRVPKARKGGKVKRVVKKVRKALAKIWVELLRTEDVQVLMARK